VSEAKDISIFQQAPDMLPDAETTFEPGFAQTRSLQPDYSDPEWCEKLVRHLERQILRTPGDLNKHVQRINALLAAGQRGDRVFAAALDLHAALGVNGQALQRRIHEQIFPALEDWQRTALVAARSGGAVFAGDAGQYCLLPQTRATGMQLVAIKVEADSGNRPSVDFDIG
jgi:hypothetical protein